MRAAWDSLPPALQSTLYPLVAEHSLGHSRDRVQKGILSDKTLKELPPVKQRLFRDNPVNGRRALYAGAHAGHIVDWPEATGKSLLYEVMWRADQPEFRWRTPGARATSSSGTTAPSCIAPPTTTPSSTSVSCSVRRLAATS